MAEQPAGSGRSSTHYGVDRRSRLPRRSPTCPYGAVTALRLEADSLRGQREFSCETRPESSTRKNRGINGGR